MTNTNMLLKAQQSDLQSSDLVRLWSNKFGGDVALSLTILNDYLETLNAAATVSNGLVTQYASPSATGFTVNVTEGNTWLVLTPAAGYATGTIDLPAADHGDELLLNTTQAVTTLTISTVAGDSVVGGPTTLAANDFFRLRYDEVLNRWYRVG